MEDPTPVSDTTTTDSDPTPVEWRRRSFETVASPVVCRLPHLEVKLEHPDLEPDGHGERFAPDAVPYELDGTPRIFYWRPALVHSSSDPDDWVLACASTHELVGIDSLPAGGPALVTETVDGTALVVDGTIGGDTTFGHVSSYATPVVSVTGLTGSAIEVTVDGDAYRVSRGERRRIHLPERRVEPVAMDDDSTTVAPELVVRYPGRRELHHPAPGAAYRLFPSFGLDLEEVPNPLAVPTAAGELDHGALAGELGVDLSQRPYPERVLWQAFAYTAFDPHADKTPELTQRDDHIVLQQGTFRRD